jgi:hypothetical protein
MRDPHFLKVNTKLYLLLYKIVWGRLLAGKSKSSYLLILSTEKFFTGLGHVREIPGNIDIIKYCPYYFFPQGSIGQCKRNIFSPVGTGLAIIVLKRRKHEK